MRNGEETLSFAEIDAFCDKQMVAAVNQLAGGDFIETAAPGARFAYPKRIDLENGTHEDLFLEAEIINLDESEDDDTMLEEDEEDEEDEDDESDNYYNLHETEADEGRAWEITLTHWRLDPSRLHELVSAAQSVPEIAQELRSINPLAALQCWEVTSISVNSDDKDYFEIRKYRELQDEHGNKFWDDKSPEDQHTMDDDDFVGLTESDGDTFEKMIEALRSEITKRDYKQAVTWLRLLGVNLSPIRVQ